MASDPLPPVGAPQRAISSSPVEGASGVSNTLPTVPPSPHVTGFGQADVWAPATDGAAPAKRLETLTAPGTLESLRALIAELETEPRYEQRPEVVTLVIDGQEFSFRPRGRHPLPQDKLIEELLRQLPRVEARGPLNPSGTLAVNGLVWHGWSTRPGGLNAQVTFAVGEPVEVKILSPTARHPDGRYKVEERLDLRAGTASTELDIPELADAIRGGLSGVKLTGTVVAEANGQRLDLPISVGAGTRLESLLSPMLARADQVKLCGRMPSQGSLAAHGLVIRLTHKPNRDVEVEFHRGQPIRAIVLSDRFRNEDRTRKHEEIIDLVAGETVSALTVTELADELEHAKHRRTRLLDVTVELEGQRFELKNPVGMFTSLERIFAERLKSAPKVIFTTRLSSTVQNFIRFGLECRHGDFGGLRVRAAFREGKPWFIEGFSDRLTTSDGQPRRLGRLYFESQRRRSTLSLAEIVSEIQALPPERHRERDVLITHDGECHAVHRPMGRQGFLDALLSNRIRVLRGVTIEFPIQGTQFRFRNLEAHLPPLPSTTRASAPFDRGRQVGYTLFSDRYSEKDGRMRAMLATTPDGAHRSDLSVFELAEEIRRWPSYVERPKEAFVHMDGGSFAIRLLDRGYTLLDEQLMMRVAQAPRVLVQTRLNSSGYLYALGRSDFIGIAHANGWVSAEYSHGELVRFEGIERPAALDGHPGLRAPPVLVQELLLGENRESLPSLKPAAARLLADPSLVTAAGTVAPERMGRLVASVVGPAHKPELTDLDRFRLQLASLQTGEDWGTLASDYESLLHRMPTYLGTRAVIAFLAQRAASGEIAWPRRALSVASGTGDLGRAFSEFSGRAAPQVTELDFSLGMLRLSSASRRVVAEAAHPPFVPGAFDLIECSAVHHLAPEESAGQLLKEASLGLRRGGLLWLKADGCFFHPDWQPAVEAAGFRLVSPFNAQLSVAPAALEGLDAGLVRKTQAALRDMRFLLAEKVADAASDEAVPRTLGFVTAPGLPARIAAIRTSVQSARDAEHDSEVLLHGARCAELLEDLTPSEYDAYAVFITAISRVYLEICFLRAELGSGEKGAFTASTADLRRVVMNALEELGPNVPGEVLQTYLQTGLRILDRAGELEESVRLTSDAQPPATSDRPGAVAVQRRG
ncbi:MAG: class I SAM-dependent methyltransferase [Myxococcaceae bacterium]